MPAPSAFATEPKAPTSGWSSMKLELTIVHPPELAGRRVALDDGLCLGREPGAGELGHATVSRKHAMVRELDGGCFLSDLESRNGTSVNGAALDAPAFLSPHAVVRLGDVFGVVDELSSARFDVTDALPGASPVVARARERIARAAGERVPVLVSGETGTGKERIAAELHRASGRGGPYLVLNCAELSRELVESQLFGHRRGAFTGANAPHEGLFVAADGGTLFLDEIGELALDLQPKLLRVLEDGHVRPVGSVGTHAVDVRVVGATNRNLEESVEAGTFRRDLYARLALLEVRVPPLRERRQDILDFLGLFAGSTDSTAALAPRLRPDAVERVLLHPWLDNLRGLRRLVHRLSIVAPEGAVGVRLLHEAMPELVSANATETIAVHTRTSAPPEPRATPSREELVAALEANDSSVRATAKHFGCDRRQVYRWIERYGIERTRS